MTIPQSDHSSSTKYIQSQAQLIVAEHATSAQPASKGRALGELILAIIEAKRAGMMRDELSMYLRTLWPAVSMEGPKDAGL